MAQQQLALFAILTASLVVISELIFLHWYQFGPVGSVRGTLTSSEETVGITASVGGTSSSSPSSSSSTSDSSGSSGDPNTGPTLADPVSSQPSRAVVKNPTQTTDTTEFVPGKTILIKEQQQPDILQSPERNFSLPNLDTPLTSLVQAPQNWLQWIADALRQSPYALILYTVAAANFLLLIVLLFQIAHSLKLHLSLKPLA